MRLRNHPKLRNQWPPSWAVAYSPGDQFLIGEGDGARLTGSRRRPGHLELEAEYQGRQHITVLTSEDQEFLDRLHDELQQNTGEPLREIGDLDLDF